MTTEPNNSERWRETVIRGLIPPAWLSQDAPESDVVVSSRVRYSRCLEGFRFPNIASAEELRTVQTMVRNAIRGTLPELHEVQQMTPVERDYLLGCRLISPDFRPNEVGRSVWLDERRRVSVMVNEEDHVRIQAVTAGWSVGHAENVANAVLEGLNQELRWMKHDTYGHLNASPSNAGAGRRRSAMFHLIGLEHTGELMKVLKALAAQDFFVRGLFGEGSKRVAAFVQISGTNMGIAEFNGGCRFVLDRERQARREVTRLRLESHSRDLIRFGLAQDQARMADALLVLGWTRWATSAGIEGFSNSVRQVDEWVSTLELMGGNDNEALAQERVRFLRHRLGPMLSASTSTGRPATT